jgi:NADPH:quinone reductase-like Zn-dependent oxidoreductase
LCRQTYGDIGQTRDGGYAEYAVLLQNNLVKIPDGMLFEHACFGACVYGPPYKAIRQVGRIQPGQTVVITGASGGLGLAAIQIAKRLGARTVAITSNASKVQRLKEVGADDVVISPDGTFGDDVRKLTGGRGADLVVELVGSSTFHGSLRSLAPGGRIAVIGELHGKPVEINLGLVIIKEWEIYGVQSASRADLQRSSSSCTRLASNRSSGSLFHWSTQPKPIVILLTTRSLAESYWCPEPCARTRNALQRFNEDEDASGKLLRRHQDW